VSRDLRLAVIVSLSIAAVFRKRSHFMPAPAPAGILKFAALVALMLGLPGCCCCLCEQLRTSQMQACQLYQQNQMLASANSQSMMSSQQLQQALVTANQRLDNLTAERSQFQQKYLALLDRQRKQASPLSADATERFKRLQQKYPQFEFDPHTGISKFNNDILFASGSSELRDDGRKLLREFAAIMNDGDAQRLNVLVVGHTDDKPISKDATRSHHPTNWNLSTDRADAVVLELAHGGLKEMRLGAAGYSMFQPVADNKDEASRRKNRRVEVFVLAPDAVVAGWDPNSVRQ
jgi:chemotaxis protein MotB